MNEEREVDLVEEARRAGQAFIDALGGDLSTVSAELQRRAKAEGRTVVQLPPRRPDGWVPPEKKAS